jgi:hypothetical protein
MTSNLRLPRSSWLQSVIQGTRATSEAWQELQHQICLVIKVRAAIILILSQLLQFKIHFFLFQSYIEQHAHQSHVRQILFEEVGREVELSIAFFTEDLQPFHNSSYPVL